MDHPKPNSPLPKFFDPARVGDVWRVPLPAAGRGRPKPGLNKFGIPPRRAGPYPRLPAAGRCAEHLLHPREFEAVRRRSLGRWARWKTTPVSANSFYRNLGRNYHHCRHHGYPHRYAGVPNAEFWVDADGKQPRPHDHDSSPGCGGRQLDG